MARPDHWCFGAHAYLVSRRGAERLLARSLPAELHIDYFLSLMAMAPNGLAGYMVPQSLVAQCVADAGTIPHYDWDQVNVRMLWSDLPIPWQRAAGRALLAAGWLLLLAVLMVWCRRAKG